MKLKKKRYEFSPDNLVMELSPEKRQEIADQVVDGYETDLRSRGDWEKYIKEAIKLFGMQADKKTEPWENCSNLMVPLLNRSAIQYQARAYTQVIPPKNIVKVVPLGKSMEEAATADRVARYMNFQLDYKFREYRRSHDASFFKQAIEGCVIRKTCFNHRKGRIVSDYVSPTDFVINYSARRLEDATRYSHRLYVSEMEIRAYKQAGIYKVELPSKDVGDDYGKENADSAIHPQNPIVVDIVKEQNLKNLGLTSVADPKNEQTYLLIEQHTWLDLNEDGIPEPYICTVDHATRQLLSIYSRVNPFSGDEMIYFTKIDFLPNPDGFYGYGFGIFLKDVNSGMNSILNQLIDAGTLSNIPAGFVLDGFQIQKGDLEWKMGKFHKVRVKNDDINKAIKQFQFAPPSQVLFALLGTLEKYADRLTTVTEIQTGEMPSSDTTATAVAAAIEQGQKVFSVIVERYHEALKWELDIIYQLNGIYFNALEYFKIVIDPLKAVTPDGQPIPIEDILPVISEDFRKELDVRPVSDPNITSTQEKAAKAQLVYQTVLANPLTSQNPNAIYAATANLLRSVGIDDTLIDVLIQPPPPPPPPPDLPQEEENQLFLNNQSPQALEQQDHKQHLAIMQEFEASPYFEALTADGKNAFDAHRRQHIAFLYGQSIGRIRADEAKVLASALQPS